MLAMADKDGNVNASIPGLARIAGISIEQTEAGIQKLKSPDTYSRTPAHEGRRIEDIDGGWRLLNHGKYRALMSIEERREYNRVKQAERRQKMSMTVNDSSTKSALSAHTKAKADTKVPPQAEGELVKKNEDHQKFITLWTEAYLAHWGERYAFQSGKDGSAVKALLAATQRSPEDLMMAAKAAWKRSGDFYCKGASSICGFNSKFNEIVAEIKQSKNSNNQHPEKKKSEFYG